MLRFTGTVLVLLIVCGAAGLAFRIFGKGREVDRVAVARERCESALRTLCAGASLPYPPRELFLRVFKLEQRLEVWAREDGPFRQLKSYPFTATSGRLGPKRQEGDRQIPEGLYEIDRFNPRSAYHLSMRVNYPNASDLVLSDPQRPGSDIYLHGNVVSIGCVAIGDAAIEELYVLCADATARGQARIPVHIFPADFDGPEWARYQEQGHADAATHRPFWQNLEKAYRAFEESRLLPPAKVDSDGLYVIEPVREPAAAIPGP